MHKNRGCKYLHKRRKKVVAYNTDAPGFLKAIESFGNIKKSSSFRCWWNCKAIALILQEQNIDVVVLNRNKRKTKFFKNNGIKAFSFEDFDFKMKSLI